jgi:hypothetical protein
MGQGDEKGQDRESGDEGKNHKLVIEIQDDEDYIHKHSHDLDTSEPLLHRQVSQRAASCSSLPTERKITIRSNTIPWQAVQMSTKTSKSANPSCLL